MAAVVVLSSMYLLLEITKRVLTNGFELTSNRRGSVLCTASRDRPSVQAHVLCMQCSSLWDKTVAPPASLRMSQSSWRHRHSFRPICARSRRGRRMAAAELAGRRLVSYGIVARSCTVIVKMVRAVIFPAQRMPTTESLGSHSTRAFCFCHGGEEVRAVLEGVWLALPRRHSVCWERSSLSRHVLCERPCAVHAPSPRFVSAS